MEKLCAHLVFINHTSFSGFAHDFVLFTFASPQIGQKEEFRKLAMASPAPKSSNSVALGRETPRSVRKAVSCKVRWISMLCSSLITTISVMAIWCFVQFPLCISLAFYA